MIIDVAAGIILAVVVLYVIVLFLALLVGDEKTQRVRITRRLLRQHHQKQARVARDLARLESRRPNEEIRRQRFESHLKAVDSGKHYHPWGYTS